MMINGHTLHSHSLLVDHGEFTLLKGIFVAGKSCISSFYQVVRVFVLKMNLV